MEQKIGEKIKEIFEDRKIKLKDFAEGIGVARQNIYRIFEKDSIDTELLLKIGEVLEHNFFQYFGEHGHNLTPTSNSEPGNFVQELENTRNELRLARKEIDYLKKIIDLMEERTKLLLEQKQGE